MTNICRCGTYNRVRAAIKVVAGGGDAKRAGLDIQHVACLGHVGEGGRVMATPVSRRRFLQASAATAGSLVVGFHIPVHRRRLRATRDRIRSERVGGCASDDTRRDPHRPLRDGAGHADGLAQSSPRSWSATGRR